MRHLFLLAITACLTSFSLVAQPPALPQKGSGPGKPLAPQEAQKLFKLDAGLRIELVACEPQIESPVAMQFDPDGRLWVVEMRDYPTGPPGNGRIRILEDKDGDGFFESATTWAEGLKFANGLLLWKDGAIVTMAPEVVFMKDGKPRHDEIGYRGFAEQNPQLRVSHPILGPDGWVYCANGLRGGNVTQVGTGKRQNPVVDLSGMDFRFDPVHPERYEAITGPGQFGNTMDEWGNRFICDNRHHLRHVVMENRYIKRNPYLAAPALIEDISVLDDGPLSSGGKVYPLSKNWTTSSLHEGRFTAACGVFIYQGGLLDTSRKRERRDDGKPVAHASGSFYRGAAFTCEPTGNLVHMEILTPKGATFSAKPHKQGVEFLATTDDWFRPVFLTHGPEGALYVVDMYRAVIEHPDFMPPELKNRPDLWAGRDKGRIWRIVPDDHKTKTPRPGLSKATLPELVKLLEHEEPWQRQTAQRLLLERNDKAMIEPLAKLFETTKSPHARILAAWMLERHGKMREEKLVVRNSYLAAMLRDTNARVREHAVRIAEPYLLRDDGMYGETIRLFEDADPRVRFQLALSIGQNDFRTSTAAILGEIVLKAGNDRWTLLAAQTSINREAAGTVLATILDNVEAKVAPELIQDAAASFAAQKGSMQDLLILELVRKRQDAAKWAALAGLSVGLERRGKTLLTASDEVESPKERNTYLKEIRSLLSEARSNVVDVKQSINDRLLHLRVLRNDDWSSTKSVLVPLVEKEANTELRISALRAIASQKDKEVPTVLIKLWPSASPAVRREILEAMLRQPARINVLLDEIEAKRLKASELDPLRTRQLLNHKDGPTRLRATKLLANNLPEDRQKTVKQYQAALDLKGDAKNGREVFKKNCATCHRVAGVGTDVGPDIADTRTKKLDALLFDILVPNAAIDANFVNYVVTTKAGGIFTGMLAVETASSITLKRAEGQTDVILRKDLDEIASTGISLMPEGLEKNISVQEMADLLRFLKDWRYLDGSVPLK